MVTAMSQLLPLVLLKQWGDLIRGTNTFPISFTNFCRIVTSGDKMSDGNDNCITANSVTLTNFWYTFNNPNPYVHNYIAIGV